MSYFACSTINVKTVTTGTVNCNRLVGVTINTGAAGALLAVYDGTTSAGRLIGTIDASTKGTLTYIARCATGNLFYQQTVGSADITISFD